MKYSANEDRSNSLNPNNKAYEASMTNRARQMARHNCNSRIWICDKTATRELIQISTIMELQNFIGQEPALKSDTAYKSCGPQCLCRVDLLKTCDEAGNLYIDIGDKDDYWNYLVVKS